ncbi:MAG TPA: hypothetical protein VNM40_01235 [Candidatus Paceibacterota bacterium]|nr:hypothetical protein [Candidatus Paceibacterota bacterium]
MGRSGVEALAIHRYLFRLALAAGNFFAWIVVFRVLFFFSSDISLALAGTAILYALQHGIAVILTPLAAAALRHGVRRALMLGTFAAVVSLGLLAELFFSRLAFVPEVVFTLISGFVIVGGIQRALYFVPYAAAAVQSHLDSRDSLIREASLALVPLIGGFVIGEISGGTGLLFAAAAAFAGASLLALFAMPETYERFEWDYSETVRALVSPSHRDVLWVAIFDGMQGAALLLVWPLAVFIILGQSFFLLGAVLSATFLMAFLARHIVRSFIVRREAQSPYVLATIAFSSWIFRLAAGTPLQIVVADIYYHSAARPGERGIDAHAHDQWADRGHYVDEYTALKEMGLAIGRIALASFFVVLVLLTPVVVAFATGIVLAGFAAAASVMLSRHVRKEAF